MHSRIYTKIAKNSSKFLLVRFCNAGQKTVEAILNYNEHWVIQLHHASDAYKKTTIKFEWSSQLDSSKINNK